MIRVCSLHCGLDYVSSLGRIQFVSSLKILGPMAFSKLSGHLKVEKPVVSMDLSVFIVPKKNIGKKIRNFWRNIRSPSVSWVSFPSCRKKKPHQTPRADLVFFRWFCEVVLWTPWVCQGRARARLGCTRRAYFFCGGKKILQRV